MKFGKCSVLILALGMVLGGVAAQAQVGVYGMFSANRLTGIPCLDVAGRCSATNGPGSGQPGVHTPLNLTGAWGGVYYDFKSYSHVKLGVDVRGGEGHSNKSATSYAGGDGASGSQFVLAGVRGTFHTPVKALKPYVQASIGWSHNDVTEPFGQISGGTSTNSTPVRTYDSFVQYEGFAGLDINIFPILDLRLVEVGIGNMNGVSRAATSGTSSVGVMSIGAGVVFHLP